MRLHADLLLCYKILHGLTTMSDVGSFFTLDKDSKTTGHSLKLRTAKPRLDTNAIFLRIEQLRFGTVLYKSETVGASIVSLFSSLLMPEDISAHLLTDTDSFD